MAADERQNLTPDEDAETVEELEDLEDLEASEDDAANVKGGGPKNEAIQPGSEPEDLR